jgi:hypothetical protein
MKERKGSEHCFVKSIYKERASITIGESRREWCRVLKGIDLRKQAGEGASGQLPTMLVGSPLGRSLGKLVEDVGDHVSA